MMQTRKQRSLRFVKVTSERGGPTALEARTVDLLTKLIPPHGPSLKKGFRPSTAV